MCAASKRVVCPGPQPRSSAASPLFGPSQLSSRAEPGSNTRVKATLDEAAPKEIAGRPIVSSDRTDGWRFFLPEGWLLFRLSGTEPLLRIYTELTDQALVTPVLEAGQTIAGVAH